MFSTKDINLQFALLFESRGLRPFAYLLYQRLLEGHICLLQADWERSKDELAEVFGRQLPVWNDLLLEPLVSRDPEGRQPFVLQADKLYLQRYFSYEQGIAGKIRAFRKNSASSIEERLGVLNNHKELLNALYPEPMPAGLQTDWQMIASIAAFLNDFTIITGGPGTGKTTTVARVLSLMLQINSGLRVALAAPTGKAAARMLESLKGAAQDSDPAMKERLSALEPFTIHRLLGFIQGSSSFRHNQNNPLPYDLLIVDESSMLDAALFAKLLDSVAQGARIILLGDKDQLASVEAGSLFGDLCIAAGSLNRFPAVWTEAVNSLINDPQRLIVKSEADTSSERNPYIVELQYSRRFSGNEGIGRLSKAVIRNDQAALRAFIGAGDAQVSIDQEYSDAHFNTWIDLYRDYIEEPDLKKALKKLNAIRVLCVTREGESGLHALNKRVEHYLEKRRLIRVNSRFYENRPVMVSSNNYHIGVFNGDLGIARKDEHGAMKVWFEDTEGGLKPVIPAYISQAETAFAMTIHKSQGSEFDRVVVVLPRTESPLLTRELLYTGITRARTAVLLQATEENILNTAGARVSRASGIAGDTLI